MRKLTALLIALAASPLLAAEEKPPEQTIREALAPVLPSGPDSIKESRIEGVYEVGIGPQVVYISADGRYLLQGDLIDLKNRVNLTEAQRGKARVSALGELGEDSMIVYSPKGEVKHTVTVFTDIDCPYCRKLHREVDQMNELGIQVRYLAYPRAGVGSASYDKAVSVWCADDRQKAMDQAKRSGEVAKRSCDAPVKQHMATADRMGVQGTPAIVLDSGKMLPGYVPAERLARILEQQ